MLKWMKLLGWVKLLMLINWLVLFCVLVIECVEIGLLLIDSRLEVCLVWLCM